LPIEQCTGDILIGANNINLLTKIDHLTGDVTIASGASGQLYLPFNYSGAITNNASETFTVFGA
jgi:hypothetical protein